jgi:hypothetical protein
MAGVLVPLRYRARRRAERAVSGERALLLVLFLVRTLVDRLAVSDRRCSLQLACSSERADARAALRIAQVGAGSLTWMPAGQPVAALPGVAGSPGEVRPAAAV